MAFIVELRKIHSDSRLSEETNCYSADLVVNGVKVGTVGNHGHGGSDEQHIDPKSGWTVQKLDEECAKHYPPLDMSKYNMANTPADLELVCGNIVDRHLTMKSNRRAMVKSILVFVGDGTISQFSYKGVKKIEQHHIDALLKNRPEFVGKVLNLMTDDEIWELRIK